jgi:hypothetical protein
VQLNQDLLGIHRQLATDIHKLNYIKPALCVFGFRDEGLRSTQAGGQFFLREACFDARLQQEGEQ